MSPITLTPNGTALVFWFYTLGLLSREEISLLVLVLVLVLVLSPLLLARYISMINRDIASHFYGANRAASDVM